MPSWVANLFEHLGVDLADAAFGDVEQLPDLAEGQPFVVVEHHHQALAFGQLCQVLLDELQELAPVYLLAGIERMGIGHGFQWVRVCLFLLLAERFARERRVRFGEHLQVGAVLLLGEPQEVAHLFAGDLITLLLAQ
jgi:hypothetical protein